MTPERRSEEGRQRTAPSDGAEDDTRASEDSRAGLTGPGRIHLPNLLGEEFVELQRLSRQVYRRVSDILMGEVVYRMGLVERCEDIDLVERRLLHQAAKSLSEWAAKQAFRLAASAATGGKKREAGKPDR